MKHLNEKSEYITRGGDVITLSQIGANKEDGMPWVGSNGLYYDPSGEATGASRSQHIVQEKLKLKAGGTYLDRKGDIVTVRATKPEDFVAAAYKYHGDNGLSYTQEGAFLKNGVDESDLIEKVPTTPTPKVKKTKDKSVNKPKDTQPVEAGENYQVIRGNKTVFTIRKTDKLKKLSPSLVDWDHVPVMANSLDYIQGDLLPDYWYWSTATKDIHQSHGHKWPVHTTDKAANLDKLDKNATYYRPA